MDHIKHQRSQTSSRFHILKKAIQVIFSLSFVSFLLSSSSLLLVGHRSFNFYLSTFSMKLQDYGIDRHYIFLLCNGLLVFIVKNSGLISNSPSWGMDRNDVSIKNRGSHVPAPGLSKTKPLEVEEEERRENRILPTEKERGGNGVLTTEEEVDGEEREMDQENWSLALKEEEEEEVEEEEQETGLLSTEELNKKCDDFIKKMKEGIKFEAQQLVMFQSL